MAGLETLESAQQESTALAPLTSQDVAFEDQALSDEAALKIVLQDTIKAENYLSGKHLPQDWDLYDDMFRALVKPRVWPGTDVPRANLGMPIVMEAIENVLPQVHMAFFSAAQPFLLSPVGKTDPKAARAASKVLCWALKQTGFKDEIRRHLKSCFLYGFGISKYGWRSYTKKVKQYYRDKQPDQQATDVGAIELPTAASDVVKSRSYELTLEVPTFENIELRNILIDPACRIQDCRRAKYVVFQKFIDANDLRELENDETYKNIPSEAELREILPALAEPTTDSMLGLKAQQWRENQAEPQRNATSSDPTKQPLEILEYWAEDRVITVLQRKIVIRNEENEFDAITFLSNAFIDVIGSAYGLGIGFLLRGEQRLQQGTVNSWIDFLALKLNPAYQRVGGMSGGTQQIKLSPGKIETGTGELKPLLHDDSIAAEAATAIEASEGRAQRRVGITPTDMPTQALRTGSGVQAFQSSFANKLQYFIEMFADLVYVPALEAMLQLCKDHLKPSQINAILTDEEGQAFQGDVMDIYNGQYRFEVLSSTKLAARQATAQLIPMFVQLFSAAPVQDSLTQQGKKVNYTELITTALELAGYPESSIIQDMTDEDKQRAAQNNPALVKAQMDAQAQQVDQSNKLQQIEAKGEATAGNTIVRSILKNVETETALKHELSGMMGGENG